MSDTAPTWALKLACELSAVGWDFYIALAPRHVRRSIQAFARYIVKHQDEPVDPLLLEAREVAASAYEGLDFAGIASRIRDGDRDDGLHVSIALAALKRRDELGDEK